MIGGDGMLKVYIDVNALSSICLEEMDKPIEEQNKWFRILSDQETIYYISPDGSDINFDKNEPLMLFSQATHIAYENATAYIQDVLTDNSKVLEQSCAAFLLDIDAGVAEKIQKDYGVIFQSVDSLDTKELEIREDYSLDKKEEGCNWRDILEPIKNTPSNSLLIIDRYLFADDTLSRHSGIDNIQSILHSILPSTFRGVYQIIIIFDTKTLHKECSYEDIAKKISKLKKAFKKPYSINMSIMGLTEGADYIKDDTHNRRIVSNYYWLYADHKLCAFINNFSTASQYITVNSLYSSLLKKGGRSSASNKEHTKLIKKFTKMLKYLREQIDNENTRATYKLTINGNHELSVNELECRLFNL